jgi:hypothetical protein
MTSLYAQLNLFNRSSYIPAIYFLFTLIFILCEIKLVLLLMKVNLFLVKKKVDPSIASLIQ